MALHPWRHLPGHGESAHIADDEGVHPGPVQRAEERRQPVNVVGMHEDVAGDVHLHAMVVGEGHRGGNLVHAEVRRPRSHAEPLSRQIHRIGPEGHGSPQLLHPTRRRKELHGYVHSLAHRSILRDSEPLHPKSAAPQRQETTFSSFPLALPNQPLPHVSQQGRIVDPPVNTEQAIQQKERRACDP